MFIDLQKIFDNVNHKILLHELESEVFLFHISKSVTSLNKLVNRDMKRLNKWLSEKRNFT